MKRTMPSRSEIEELREAAYSFAEHVIVENREELEPTILALREDRARIGIRTNLGDTDAEKDLLVAGMRHLVQDEHIIATAMVTEAWMVVRAESEDALSLPPRLAPDRREVLVLAVESRRGLTVELYEIAGDRSALMRHTTLASPTDVRFSWFDHEPPEGLKA
jgi:hypothetical protein